VAQLHERLMMMMMMIVEVQTQFLMVNYEYYIVCRSDDGRQNDLKNYQTKIFSMFSSVLLAIFSVCVLELDKIFCFFCWSSLLYKWEVLVENSK